MAAEAVELTDSEWAILEVVWARGRCTAPDVQEAVAADRGWAYTTVKTMMDRMVGKGLLEVEKVRNLHFYGAAVSGKEARQGEIRRTLRRAFNGAFTPMMQFMIETNQLSEAEYEELERMMKKRDRNS